MSIVGLRFAIREKAAENAYRNASIKQRLQEPCMHLDCLPSLFTTATVIFFSPNGLSTTACMTQTMQNDSYCLHSIKGTYSYCPTPLEAAGQQQNGGYSHSAPPPHPHAPPHMLLFHARFSQHHQQHRPLPPRPSLSPPPPQTFLHTCKPTVMASWKRLLPLGGRRVRRSLRKGHLP